MEVSKDFLMPPTYTYIELQGQRFTLREPKSHTTAQNIWKLVRSTNTNRTYQVKSNTTINWFGVIEVVMWDGTKKKYDVMQGNKVIFGPDDWVSIQTVTRNP